MISNALKATTSCAETAIRVADEGWRTWQELVEKKVEEGLLVDITCPIYSTSDKDFDDEIEKCLCGRLKRSHSFAGVAQTHHKNEKKFKPSQMGFIEEKKALTAYGRLGIFGNDARVCEISKQI